MVSLLISNGETSVRVTSGSGTSRAVNLANINPVNKFPILEGVLPGFIRSSLAIINLKNNKK